VIGAGAAGLVTSYIAPPLKARVTLIEADRLGGDCLNHRVACPANALISSPALAAACAAPDRLLADGRLSRGVWQAVAGAGVSAR